MPYRYLQDVATADVAFMATGKSLHELFIAAAEATMNVMVEELDSIASVLNKTISLQEDSLDMLMFKFLQEFIFLKDAEELLLRTKDIEIKKQNQKFILKAEAYGEIINTQKHELNVDVKAVTFHRFKISENKDGWEATVVLDI